MEFKYSYKTSEGTRIEDRITAKSREAVFEELRSRGIKAIKVDPIINPWKKIAFVCFDIAAALGILALAYYWYAAAGEVKAVYRADKIHEYSTRADSIILQCDTAIKMLNIRKVCELKTESDLERLATAVQHGRDLENLLRYQMRSLLAGEEPTDIGDKEKDDIATICKEVSDSVEFFSEIVDLLDTLALMLSENRTSWSFTEGGIRFVNQSENNYFHEILSTLIEIAE